MTRESLDSNHQEKLYLGSVNLETLEVEYSDPASPEIFRRFELTVEAAIEADKTEDDQADRFGQIVAGLYGSSPRWDTKLALEDIDKQTLATSLFMASLSEGMAGAQDLELFSWRLQAFLSRMSEGRYYVGNHLTIGKENRPFSYNSNVTRRQFAVTAGRVMSLTNLALFAERSPELADQALAKWEEILSDFIPDRIDNPTSPLVQERDVENVRSFIEAQKPAPELQAVALDLLFKIQTKARWQRKETPTPFESITLKKLMVNLELLPVEHIPLADLEALHEWLSQPELELRLPAPLITSSIKALENFVKSLAGGRSSGRLTQVIASRLETYSGDNPLGYTDMTQLANLLTPVFDSQGIRADTLGTNDLASYPKAVDRILYAVMAENQAGLSANQWLDHFSMVADCIKMAAIKGIEGKLAQKVLTVGDFALRYANLPPSFRRQYWEKIQAGKLSEAEAEGLIRMELMAKGHRPFKAGWGRLS